MRAGTTWNRWRFGVRDRHRRSVMRGAVRLRITAKDRLVRCRGPVVREGHVREPPALALASWAFCASGRGRCRIMAQECLELTSFESRRDRTPSGLDSGPSSNHSSTHQPKSWNPGLRTDEGGRPRLVSMMVPTPSRTFATPYVRHHGTAIFATSA